METCTTPNSEPRPTRARAVGNRFSQTGTDIVAVPLLFQRRGSATTGRACRSACAVIVLAGTVAGPCVAADDESVAALAERIRAAAVIVRGEAGRPYTSWDGSDPSTIRTFTPLRVDSVLKGTVGSRNILLRQPGGEVAGIRVVGAVGVEFDPGERLIVFVNRPDPSDGSYDIPAGLEGAYRITADAAGIDGIDLRLGADARAYSSKEKAPGTLLTRIPVSRFEELARGASPDQLESQRAVETPHRVDQSDGLPASGRTVPGSDRSAYWLGGLAAVLAIGLVVLFWRALFR